MSAPQLLVKDACGRLLTSCDNIKSYRRFARLLRSLDPVIPLTVWQHDTITGNQRYDGKRTAKLSAVMVAIRKAATA